MSEPTSLPENGEPTAVPAGEALFPNLGNSPNTGAFDIEAIQNIPVTLTVELGRCRMSIRDLLQLGQGSVVELDNMAGTPMDVYVNGYLIAQGEVVVVNERYGIRLTDIVTPADRLSRLPVDRG